MCGAIVIGHENGNPSGLDGYSEGGFSPPQDVASDRCEIIGGDGTSMSTVDESHDRGSKRAAAQSEEKEVVLHELWFALSRQDQLQFGGQFSRMLLRAVEHGITYSTDALESKS